VPSTGADPARAARPGCGQFSARTGLRHGGVGCSCVAALPACAGLLRAGRPHLGVLQLKRFARLVQCRVACKTAREQVFVAAQCRLGVVQVGPRPAQRLFSNRRLHFMQMALSPLALVARWLVAQRLAMPLRRRMRNGYKSEGTGVEVAGGKAMATWGVAALGLPLKGVNPQAADRSHTRRYFEVLQQPRGQRRSP
jgi:hypothetical protein